MTKSQKLSQLKKLLSESSVAPELAQQATQLVFGSGDINADIVFVGEAPGKKEDITGRPFVGASGRVLDELLDSIGLSRDDIYITNIVKYRPPDNRDPTAKEKEAFRPYLEQQLEIIAPKVVATLGRHSGQVLVSGLDIGKDHGIEHKLVLENKGTELTILPLYHPAAAIYNRALRQTLFNDIAKLKRYIKQSN
ncbi:MAG: uracil-DNA glycosylase family 4 [Candidatus Saccharimonadales bacterium]|jgi:uracil-DNA glycosylase family 4